MELLFNKNNNAEIHDILGFSDADIDISKLWPYLKTATREIVKIIGKDNYSKALDFYKDETSEENEDDEIVDESEDNDEAEEIANPDVEELLSLIQYAVALDAMRKFAPLIDVSITNDGRLFRRDDHHGAATNYMIESSNAAMERRYYEAVDELLAFILEEDGLEQSDYMVSFSGLYVPNLDEFQKFVHINNSHLLYLKLAPSLRLCEQRELMNRMGDKYLDLKGLKDNHITSLAQNICVYYAMADGIQKLSVQLFPEGLGKSNIDHGNRKNGSGYDKEATSKFYEDKLSSLYKSLETAIKKLNANYTPRATINFDKGDGFVTIS